MKIHPALLLLLLVVASPSLAQTPPAPPVLTAIVTDTEGRTTTVADLKAVYAYNTNRSGDKVLIERTDALVFQLQAREGRVTTTDVLRVPFAEIHRFRFPGNFRVEIYKHDGSSVVLDQVTGAAWKPDAQHKLEETGADGQIRKSVAYYEYEIATTMQDGEFLGAAVIKTLLLSGLQGKARTSSGREGDFSIGKYDVKEVEFR